VFLLSILETLNIHNNEKKVQPFWPFIALLLVNKQKQPADKANTIARRKSSREINQ